MIVKSHRQSSVALLLTIHGSIVPKIMPIILLAAAVGVLAQLLHVHKVWYKELSFSFGPFTALGVAISLFLGFHNNASYGRWWEARTIWGKHIIDVRNLLRFLLSGQDGNGTSCLLVQENPQSSRNTMKQSFYRVDDVQGEISWREKIAILSIAHVHAMRHQLRPECSFDQPRTALQDRNRFLTVAEQERVDKYRNPASHIVHEMGRWVARADLDSYERIHLYGLVDQLCSNQTASERIQNTSLPLAYSLLVHRTATLFVFLIPFALVKEMEWWTPLFTAILAYTFFGLDELARQIQEPFRDEQNGLALSAFCRTVEIDVLEALREEDTPEPLKAGKDAVLM